MKIELGDIIYYKWNKTAYYVGAINVDSYSLIYDNKVYTPTFKKVLGSLRCGDAVLYKKVVMV